MCVYERDSEMSHLFLLRVSVDNKLYFLKGCWTKCEPTNVFPTCLAASSESGQTRLSTPRLSVISIT